MANQQVGVKHCVHALMGVMWIFYLGITEIFATKLEHSVSCMSIFTHGVHTFHWLHPLGTFQMDCLCCVDIVWIVLIDKLEVPSGPVIR